VIYKEHGKTREMGLGSQGNVHLTEAIAKAQEVKQNVAAGRPAREPKLVMRTFKEVARESYENVCYETKSKVAQRQYWQSLEDYVHPHIGDVPVDKVRNEDIITIANAIVRNRRTNEVGPFKIVLAETARKTMGRVSIVFARAIALGLRGPSDNPTKLVKEGRLLKIKKPKTKHHRSLHWSEMAKFWNALSERTGASADLTRFILLTGCRLTEARLAKWSEYDEENALLKVPAERMKNDDDHEKVLSKQAVEVLELRKQTYTDSEYIFVQETTRKPLSDNALSALHKRMGYYNLLTTHGFRSSMTDYFAEHDIPHEIAKLTLSHKHLNDVEAAYQRSRLLARRRKPVQAYADLVTGVVSTDPLIGDGDASLVSKASQ
jgi:integrase